MLESYFFKLKYFSTKPLFLDSTLYTTETVHAVVSSNKELCRVPVEVVNESFECAVIDGRKLSDQELVPLQLHLGVHATYKIQSHIWCMLSIKCFYFSNLFSKFFITELHRTFQSYSKNLTHRFGRLVIDWKERSTTKFSQHPQPYSTLTLTFTKVKVIPANRKPQWVVVHVVSTCITNSSTCLTK